MELFIEGNKCRNGFIQKRLLGYFSFENASTLGIFQVKNNHSGILKSFLFYIIVALL